MQSIVLTSESKSNIKLLSELAKKLGLKVVLLSDDDKEDIAILNAINKNKTGEYVNTENFVKNLRK